MQHDQFIGQVQARARLSFRGPRGGRPQADRLVLDGILTRGAAVGLAPRRSRCLNRAGGVVGWCVSG